VESLNINNKILIMAGGTGGHIFPALCIAEYLLSKGMQVEWLGTKNSMEARVIGETDIRIHYISISGVRGKSLWKKIFSPLVIFVAIVQSMIKVISIKPGCVLGMGGFVTGPGGLAAWILRKDLLIHEQNAIAGFTNQMLFPLAMTVMEAFPGAFERKQNLSKSSLLRRMIKPGKAIFIGNPVRDELSSCPEPVQRLSSSTDEKLKVLIVGGSLGAVVLNTVIPEFLEMFSENIRPKVLHQCGRKNFDTTVSSYSKHNIELNGAVQVVPFIDDMAESYCWADIIICRAGAITVSEIASIGIASILIPYPYAVDDHQTENARILEKNNAAWVIAQEKLNANVLFEIVSPLNQDREKLLNMAVDARNASNDSATEEVAELCMEACHA
jgi:UDP-N-acetylglucosamine--N-acetylmuramyl-(pentapeptide) pyrophosphoryl-undecaprenol N-acetylglucosamine transferase